jgi:fatty-acyl-CoA synthase
MNLVMLLEMAAEAAGDRIAVGSMHGGLTYSELLERARAVGTRAKRMGAERIVVVDVNSEAVPVALFGAAAAGIPFVPVNYRLADDQLRSVLERTSPSLAVVDPSVPGRIPGGIEGIDFLDRCDLMAAIPSSSEELPADGDDIAVLLFTSGTTGEPKAAVLRHRHLTGYILSSVEFLGADPADAALVSVPPYHIAGVAAVLSSVFLGRRVVYLSQFDAAEWVATAKAEHITHAMVVPTMLGRIVDELESQGTTLPRLRHLSYGGGRMPVPVLERAMKLLPEVGFVNAYGLTETSSTVAVLTPDDHREAFAATDEAVRARLGSVGRPLPNIELEIRGPDAEPLPAGVSGEVWVRGEQVSGEYLGMERPPVDGGWFATNDGGHLDQHGYLFVEGRLDDVIVRGGENMSPGEIEDVLAAHPHVADAAVFGVPDDEWGEVVAAVVVPVQGTEPSAEELQAWVRSRLRSTRCPVIVEFRDELPYNDTGKLLRRVLKAEVRSRTAASPVLSDRT